MFNLVVRFNLVGRNLKALRIVTVVNIASHKGSSPAGFSAEKAGYYSSKGAHEAIMFKDEDPSKWNPTVTLILKRKIHPISMYFNRVDIAHTKKPALDTHWF